MGLIHQQHQILETRQIIEITLPDVLAQALDPRWFIATYLAINLRDVEDVDVNRAGVEQPALHRLFRTDATAAFVVVACNKLGRISRELRDPFEYVFGGVRCEVGNQLVVDRQVRRKDEKMTAYS